jgi:peptide/nickel transport system substrate-binding protein
MTKGTKSRLTCYGIAYVFVLLSSLPSSVAAQTEGPRYGGTLRVAYVGDPKSWFTFTDFWSISYVIQIQSFNRLITQDKDWNVIGDLARSWDISDGNRVFTFHLYDNVTFHDGTRFTAHNVEFLYNMLFEMRPEVNGTGEWRDVKALDDYTVRLRFHKPRHIETIETATSAWSCLELPMHIYKGTDYRKNPANWKPIGTGPFKVVEYKEGSYIRMEAFDKYFKGRPYLDKLEFLIISDQTTALMALEKGEIDCIDNKVGVSPSEVAGVQANPKLGVGVERWPGMFRVTFNFREEARQKNPWLSDVRVRRALWHAIDRQTIIDKVLFGITGVEDTVMSKENKYYHNDKTMKYPFDKTKAESLMDEAGYRRGPDGVRFRPQMVLYKSVMSIGEVIRQMWKDVGVELELVPTEDTAFFSMYEAGREGLKDFPFGINKFGGPFPSGIEYWSSGKRPPPVGGNCGFWNNTEYTQLIENGLVEFDPNKRKQIYYRAQEIAAEEVPYIFLWTDSRLSASSKEFTNFESLRPATTRSRYDRIWWTKGTLPTPVTTTTRPPTTTTTQAAAETPTTTYALAGLALVVVIIGGYMLARKRRRM